MISQRGFFIWLAVRPSDFVWPGLKVTETESAAESTAVGVYLSQMYLCCSWKWSIAGSVTNERNDECSKCMGYIEME